MTHTPAPWKVLWKHDTHKVKRDKEGRILGGVIVPFEDYCHARDCVNSHEALVAALRFLLNPENVCLTHAKWGEGSNQKQVDAMIEKAKNALALVEKGA